MGRDSSIWPKYRYSFKKEFEDAGSHNFSTSTSLRMWPIPMEKFNLGY